MGASKAKQLAEIESALDREIRPGLEPDGTIEVVDLDGDDVLQIRLAGACPSCPSTAMGLIFGIEEVIRRHVPSVRYVEAVP